MLMQQTNLQNTFERYGREILWASSRPVCNHKRRRNIIMLINRSRFKLSTKVRSTGEQASTEDLLRIAKLFKDDFMLDNLSRPQLVSMCRYMNINAFGTDNFLRYQISNRMAVIKEDDKVSGGGGGPRKQKVANFLLQSHLSCISVGLYPLLFPH